MAGITNELEDILKAILGEEVRQSIYRGMVKVNGQAERLEDVVGALNDAITAETSTNVRSFVEKVENAVWYKDGDEVSFGEDCGDDYILIPGIASPGGAQNTTLLSLTIDLPKAFKPSDSGYTIDIDNLTLGNLFVFYSDGFVNTGIIPIVTNGVLDSDIIECLATNEHITNKLHVLIVVPDTTIPTTGPIFLSVAKLDFTIAENSPE